MKLGLGTAQFGLNYGISNTHGKVSLQEGAQILAQVKKAGMRIVDTAPSYGDSEAALGELLPSSDSFQIVTKTQPVTDMTCENSEAVERMFHASLSRLRRKNIYGLLVHHVEDLLGPGGRYLLNILHTLRDRGFVQKIGVSIYNARQVDETLKIFKPDIIQVPFNVFDQRLVQSGHLQMLKNLGVEIHARSVFLQGLLLMDPQTLDPYFQSLKHHFSHYREFMIAEGLTPLETALRFVLQQPEIDVVLVGVAAAAELTEILKAGSGASAKSSDWKRFSVQDERVLNPSLWKVSR